MRRRYNKWLYILSELIYWLIVEWIIKGKFNEVSICFFINKKWLFFFSIGLVRESDSFLVSGD